MYCLKIELPIKTESNNVLLRKHFHKSNLANKEIYDLIFLKTRQLKPEIPLTNFKIKLVRHFWKSLDYDNLVSSFKSIIDGLARANIIKDDKWEFTGPWDVSQEYRPKDEGPLISITITESREIVTWKN
jgi:hypothetical protein